MEEQRQDRTARERSDPTGADTYEVRVQGRLSPRDVERLGGLVVKSVSGEGENVTTLLRGRLADQSALMGVMNALHTWQIPVIAVESIPGDESDA